MSHWDDYKVEVCACSQGPYVGAQMMGTVGKCERCGFVLKEQLDAIKAESWDEGFTKAGRLILGMDHENWPPAPNPYRNAS